MMRRKRRCVMATLAVFRRSALACGLLHLAASLSPDETVAERPGCCLQGVSRPLPWARVSLFDRSFPMTTRAAVFPPPLPQEGDIEAVTRWVLGVFDQASALLSEPAANGDDILASSEQAAEQLVARLASATEIASSRWRLVQIRRLTGLAPAAVVWAIRHGGDRQRCQALRPHLLARCARILDECPHSASIDD
jgi:hypothetical protein